MRFLAILVLATMPLVSQPRYALAPAAVPDHVLFSSFFRHLSASEAAAGDRESPIRRNLRVRAGFTGVEFALIRDVALSCHAAYDAKTRSGAAEVRELAAQNPRIDRSRQPVPAIVAARIEALERERAQVIHDCLDSPKRALGEARFALFDRHVRVEGTSIRYVDPAKPGANGKAAPAQPRVAATIPV